MTLGGLLIVVCIAKTVQHATDHYWPLLIVGFVIVCVSTPFYYYTQNRDKIKNVYDDAGIQALDAAGKAPKKPPKL